MLEVEIKVVQGQVLTWLLADPERAAEDLARSTTTGSASGTRQFVHGTVHLAGWECHELATQAQAQAASQMTQLELGATQPLFALASTGDTLHWLRDPRALPVGGTQQAHKYLILQGRCGIFLFFSEKVQLKEKTRKKKG
jgi:hypothetical protein